MTCSARCRAGTRLRTRSTGSTRSSRRCIGSIRRAAQVESWTPPEKLGSFAPSAGGGLIIAGRNGFALYDPRSGAFERIADPENKAEENILNDGRCDSRGRFWVGSMTKTMKRASGKLYRVDKGRVDALDDDIWVSNGVAWSPDETTLYFADSHVHTIFAYDYDLATGTIGKRRVFAETKGQAGVPDGASIDARRISVDRDVRRRMHRALRAGRAARPHRADAGQPRRPPARSAGRTCARCM